MRLVSYAVVAAALIFALPATAVQRTFVASYGSDANAAGNCAFTNPCRGFQAAHDVTDVGGEVVALDAAGYGVITITKSISLLANSGFYAGIAVGTGTGITIATASVKVVLRGLNINSVGGTIGISMTNGSALTIENCVLSNFTTTAVIINTPALVRINNVTVRDNFDGIVVSGGATADVSQLKAYGNSDAGIYANAATAVTTTLAISDSDVSQGSVGIGSRTQTAGAATKVSVTRSSVTGTATGLVALQGGGGTPFIGVFSSMVTHNGTGLVNSGGTVETAGHNFVHYNTNDTSGVITTIAPM